MASVIPADCVHAFLVSRAFALPGTCVGLSGPPRYASRVEIPIVYPILGGDPSIPEIGCNKFALDMLGIPLSPGSYF
jgi:hypothetical protein